MRIVSYNILDGGTGRADPIAEVLLAQRPEVVCLLEADDAAVLERVARRLAMDFIVAPGRRHACALLSRLPIRATWNHSLLIPDFEGSLLQAELLAPGGRPLPVGVVHLHPGAWAEDEARRLEQLKPVLKLMARAAVPQLLAGDFNATSPLQQLDRDRLKPSSCEAFVAQEGMLPTRAITSIMEAGFVDTLAAARGESAKSITTFSTQYPGQRVDYVFTRGEVRVVDAWVETDRLATYASDHFPVGAEVTW
jgi:endonuclease/exonuclease/phosphatase family metal-dependent hydrolase